MRPDVLSAKFERLTEMMADQQRIKSMPKSERPGQASLEEVRACGETCFESVLEVGGSVAAIEEQTKLPSERLEEEA